MRKVRTGLLILIMSMVFICFSSNVTLATSLQDMLLEIKCTEDQETLDHQHGCALHKEMLAFLENLVEEGNTKNEILDAVADKYGEGSLVNVRKKGFGLLSYLVPFIGLPLIFIIIYTSIEKWVKEDKKHYQEEKESVELYSRLHDYEKKFDEEYEAFKKRE